MAAAVEVSHTPQTPAKESVRLVFMTANSPRGKEEPRAMVELQFFESI